MIKDAKMFLKLSQKYKNSEFSMDFKNASLLMEIENM